MSELTMQESIDAYTSEKIEKKKMSLDHTLNNFNNLFDM
jgi:hypothetical protein